jgi:phospholipid-translocating ATPase
LTGDKLETAVNIAFSCGHFKRTMEILELSGTGRVEAVLNDLRYFFNMMYNTMFKC